MVQVSLAARHQVLQQQTRLVVLPPGDPIEALSALRGEGFILVALENKEACCVCEDVPPAMPLWDTPLGTCDRVLFLAGGEDRGLPRTLLGLSDYQCYIPAAACPLATCADQRRALGQEGQNPSLNLAHAVVIALYERRRQLARRAERRAAMAGAGPPPA
uniref:tRNA/rRNA methyltransferase SpoU type domain-containing protein n=1 Tax=Pyrodinium bahamense TaxID=73915 RepID=A0A7S0B8L7_9DINO